MAAPRVSGKPSPQPKWRAVLDRMAANPLDAGSRHLETRPIGSALSVKTVRGPDRTMLGRAGRPKLLTAGHDPTIETALDELRAYECEKSEARAARSERRASEKARLAAGVAEARSNAKRDREDTEPATARERTHHEKKKRKTRRGERHRRRSFDSEDVARSREPLPLGGADNRAKLESAIERARRVEAESLVGADADRKPSNAEAPAEARRAFGEFRWRRSCADLVGLLDDAYGSFLGRENATTSC